MYTYYTIYYYLHYNILLFTQNIHTYFIIQYCICVYRNDFGVVPRMAEYLFIEVFRALDKGVTVEDMPYNTIYTTLTDIGRVYPWPAPLQGHALYLIKAIILQTRLSAYDNIPYTHTPLTLGHLESTGDLIIHRTRIDSVDSIQLKYPFLSFVN